MEKNNDALKIYIFLIVILGIFAAISVYLPQNQQLMTQELSVSKAILAMVNFGIMVIIYGGLGFIGMKLSQKIGFVNFWDPKVTNKKRFLIPLITGVLLGTCFIAIDLIVINFHNLGPIPHPPFPTSLVASITAAIGEEIIFRLFFISFWVWLISSVVLKGRWTEGVFWMIAGASALVFTIAHLPSIMLLNNLSSVIEIPLPLALELLLMNGSLSIIAAYYFKNYGLLAAIGVHFWVDLVWHVIWGLL